MSRLLVEHSIGAISQEQGDSAFIVSASQWISIQSTHIIGNGYAIAPMKTKSSLIAMQYRKASWTSSKSMASSGVANGIISIPCTLSIDRSWSGDKQSHRPIGAASSHPRQWRVICRAPIIMWFSHHHIYDAK